jgi:hypothetical protein
MADSLAAQVRFAAPYPVRPIFAVTIKTAHGAPILGVSNRWTRDGCDGPALIRGSITCDLKRLPLMPGTYMLDPCLGDFADPTQDLDVILDAVALEVLPADVSGTVLIPRATDGRVFRDASWSVGDDDPTS